MSILQSVHGLLKTDDPEDLNEVGRYELMFVPSTGWRKELSRNFYFGGLGYTTMSDMGSSPVILPQRYAVCYYRGEEEVAEIKKHYKNLTRGTLMKHANKERLLQVFKANMCDQLLGRCRPLPVIDKCIL